MVRDTNDFDEFTDHDLAQRLGSAAGSMPDTDVALSGLHGRVAAARQRRTRIAVVALIAGIVGVGSIAALQSRQGTTVSPAERGVPISLEPTPPPTASAQPTATDETGSPSTDGTTGSTADVEAPGPTSVTPRGDTASAGAPVPTSPRSTAPPSATVPTRAAVTQTFTAVGGSIRVAVDDRGLVLVEVLPADGHDAAVVEERADRIVVEFAAAARSSAIRVDFVDGAADAGTRESERGDDRRSGDDRGDDGRGDDRGDGRPDRGDGRGDGDRRDGSRTGGGSTGPGTDTSGSRDGDGRRGDDGGRNRGSDWSGTRG